MSGFAALYPTYNYYLVGLPSRTLCRTLKYKVTSLYWSPNDHTLKPDPDNEDRQIVVHKKGHEKHKQITKGPYRLTRYRNVYTDCGECN